MKAVEDKTPLRFRMFYVVNSGYSAANTGYYVIYDAYVTSHKTRGGDNKAVTMEFKLEPDGGILARVLLPKAVSYVRVILVSVLV